MSVHIPAAIESNCYEDEKYRHLIGIRFGKLTTIHAYHRIDGRNSRLIMVCKCECGNESHQRIEALRNGSVKSCGCSNHHLTHTKLYYVWRNIKNRCFRKSCSVYRWYGGRGITMCESWRNDPVAFIEWCNANGYRPGLQIDRIDNYKGYGPDNCRFVTRSENQRNTSSNRRVSLNGETRTLVEWCELFGVPYDLVYGRIRRGVSIKDALLTPIDKSQSHLLTMGNDGKKHGKTILYHGQRHTCFEWARIKGMSWHTIQNRLKLGWEARRIFNTPVRKMRDGRQKQHTMG